MDSKWDTLDGLGAADAQRGEESTSRDPGNEDTLTTPGDSDGRLEVIADQTPGQDNTRGVQPNHEGNTGQAHTRGVQPNHEGNTGQAHTRGVQTNHEGNTGQDHTGGVQPNHEGNTGQDHTGGVQTNHEGNTGQDHPRKLKKGKRIQWASGCLATHQQRDQRFQRELEHLHKHPKIPDFRLQAPPRKPYQPYVFNSLWPYYSVSTIHLLADHVKGHRSRRTVFGLIEPWVDLRMDNDLQSDVDPDLVSHPRKKHTQKLELGATTSQGVRGATTSQGVRGATTSQGVRGATTSQGVRGATTSQGVRGATTSQGVRGATSSQGARRKLLTEYQQTRAHLDQMPPASRKQFCSSYVAYIQHTPGSRRAISDCMHQLTLSSR